MHIRTATPEDKSGIIDLLKKSLGESTIPKSEALWAWKHEQNPFGVSHVLLAEENNTLIGLRAFMQWEWQWNGKTFRAIRAVDTATHPEHQGKGIFKKLTLQQAEACKKQGIHFVFNTPNKQSQPGYIKMGWVEQGKMPLKLKVIRPVSLIYSKLFIKNKFTDLGEDPTPIQQWGHEITKLVIGNSQKTSHLSTILSPEYISWRYANNPLFRYNYFTDHSNYLLISRVKKYSFMKELRLVEFILLNPNADPAFVSTKIKRDVYQYCKAQKIEMVSFSGQQYQYYKPYFHWMGIIPVKALGPIITLKDLNMNENFPQLLNTNNWNYSLGDMELF